MRHISALLTLLLIFASANTAAAMLVEEAGEIPYQVSRADRIAIGTVTDVRSFYNYRVATIEVDEWLDSPLPTKAITVRTEGGTNVWVEDEASFALNETTILMLEDADVSEHRFKMVCGEPGKRPLSDRDAILKALSDRPRRSGDSEDEVMRYPPNPVEFIPPASDRGLDIGVPVTLVLDNVRYQKCKLVWELAESLDIELLYIPPYSPNLNLARASMEIC